MSVGELFEFKNGLNKGKEYFGKGTPIVNFTDVFKHRYLTAGMLKGTVNVTPKEIGLYSAQKGDVFFTRTSETQEEIGMASVLVDDVESCVFSGFVLRARPKTSLLLPKYCSYCFSSYTLRKEIVKSSSYTTRALTSGTKLSRLIIPVPSLEEQARIVTILDLFGTLINDISQGLPAEISARRKQYEYYRDKLLTFKEKVS
jgi:type I restriction enzyme S subunit